MKRVSCSFCWHRLAYVDVTSTWRLRSKWARMQVAAAGMYVELFLAAVATLVWARAPLGVLSNVCFNIMTTASVMTVLFNANPLMRFDGYYIVSDLLELPNLYVQGQQYVAYLLRRLLFGIRVELVGRLWLARRVRAMLRRGVAVVALQRVCRSGAYRGDNSARSGHRLVGLGADPLDRFRHPATACDWSATRR